MSRRILVLAVACTLATSSACATVHAQAAPPDAPTPAHERLTFFEGTWTVKEVPPERRYRETCAFMEGGRRHMVCRTRSIAASGRLRESMSIFSYDPTDSTYLYYGLRSGGAVETLRGRPSEGGWRFSGERGEGPARVRVLVTISRVPGGQFRLVEQTAAGDAPFGAGEAVHYVPAPRDP